MPAEPTNRFYRVLICGNLPKNTIVTWGGVVNFEGTIYAPQADIRLGSGVFNDFQGACLGKIITISDHFYFHFDEHLLRTPPMH